MEGEPARVLGFPAKECAAFNSVDFEYPAFRVDFSDALRAVKEGKQARRQLWIGLQYRAGLYLVLYTGDPKVMPMLMCVYDDGTLRPFSGAHWDLLADDWEIVE